MESKMVSAFIGDNWFVKKKEEMELSFSSCLSNPSFRVMTFPVCHAVPRHSRRKRQLAM